MQTFLPYVDFYASADCLDDKRLGKQRLEALQISNALLGVRDGWKNHPATKMWEGYDRLLAIYGLCCCAVWRSRGHLDNIAHEFVERAQILPGIMESFGRLNMVAGPHNSYVYLVDISAKPRWFHDEEFHASHRSNLLRKDPEWYGQFGWPEPPDLPYIWPSPR